jgi:serine/threonine protein kinase
MINFKMSLTDDVRLKSKVPVVSTVHVSYEGGRMTVNQYTFLSFLGRGSFAEVVLARHDAGLVAVKCFSKSRLMKKRGEPVLPVGRESTILMHTNCSAPADIRRVAGKMVVITALDKVQVEIQVMRVLASCPNTVRLQAVLADPTSDDLYLGECRGGRK